ncbi:MAG: hypothetical protein H7Y37_12280 [Anaerolineae bacterium]|nr:hypothetical protein [Gloeobacterales cyanobacterium ES-bin-313]
MKNEAAARVFASHYQLVICDDPTIFTEELNWRNGDFERGFAGNERFRMVGTEADLNDHWVEVRIVNDLPELDAWQRVTCVSFQCITGHVHIMSILDNEPSISLDLPNGNYAVYVAGSNLGVDQSSLGEYEKLTDTQLAHRKDVEWYQIFIVPGRPVREGRIKDE